MPRPLGNCPINSKIHHNYTFLSASGFSRCASAEALVVLLDNVIRHLPQVIVILTSFFCLPIPDCFCSVWTCLWQRGHHCCFAANISSSFVMLCLGSMLSANEQRIDTPYNDKSSFFSTDIIFQRRTERKFYQVYLQLSSCRRCRRAHRD